MDLTIGKPDKIIWKYTLPLFGSILFQQLYNIADSFVAGKFISENALAAVGNSYEITLIYLAFAFGCNMGASVVTARYFGAKKYAEMKTSISTAYIFTAVLCAVLMLIGLLGTPSLLRVMNTPEEIYSDTLLYVNIYTGGLIFLFVYNITTGIFAAMGDSKTPFVFLACTAVANVGMDILFVAVFKMGVAGVAWATFICQGMSGVLSVPALVARLKKVRDGEKHKVFSFSQLKQILFIAIPSTLQQSFVSVGNIIIQSLVNSFGTAVIAGYSAAIKFNNFAVTSYTAVGNGLSNYTSQNIGAQKPERIKGGFFAAVKLIACIVAVFSLVYALAPNALLKLFLSGESDVAMLTGRQFLIIVAPFYILVAIKVVSDGILRGAGKMAVFMTSTFVDLFLRIVFAYVLSARLGSMGIWCAWPGSWLMGMGVSLIFLFFYYRGIRLQKSKEQDL